MILGIDAATVGAISTAAVAIIGAVGAAAVAIINAINKRADTASVERQIIARGQEVPPAPVRKLPPVE